MNMKTYVKDFNSFVNENYSQDVNESYDYRGVDTVDEANAILGKLKTKLEKAREYLEQIKDKELSSVSVEEQKIVIKTIEIDILYGQIKLNQIKIKSFYDEDKNVIKGKEEMLKKSKESIKEYEKKIEEKDKEILELRKKNI